MQVQVVNTHAARRYREFESAMEAVRISLEESDTLVKTMRDEAGSGHYGWQVPDKKEVLAVREKAAALLDGLRKKAKDYEGELLSRGWRV